MMRLSGLLVLLAAFSAGAAEQKPSAGPRPATGDYSGSLTEEGGKGTADIKMNIKHVTTDGRITATVQTTHARKSCTARLPLNGIVLPDGGLRLEVDDGAPEGCERIYNLTGVSGGKVSGTYIDAVTRKGGKLFKK